MSRSRASYTARVAAWAGSGARSIISSGSDSRSNSSGCMADIVMILEPALAQHVAGAVRADGVVFGEGDALRVVRLRPSGRTGTGRAAPPLPPSPPGRRRRSRSDRGRPGVTGVATGAAGRHVRSGDDHRDPAGLLVKHRFAPQAPRADIVAVVAGVDHPGLRSLRPVASSVSSTAPSRSSTKVQSAW